MREIDLLILDTPTALTIGDLPAGRVEATPALKELVERLRLFKGRVLLVGKHCPDNACPQSRGREF